MPQHSSKMAQLGSKMAHVTRGSSKRRKFSFVFDTFGQGQEENAPQIQNSEGAPGHGFALRKGPMTESSMAGEGPSEASRQCPGQSLLWPHLNPIVPYFFIVFLTIIYKKLYKKQ